MISSRNVTGLDGGGSFVDRNVAATLGRSRATCSDQELEEGCGMPGQARVESTRCLVRS